MALLPGADFLHRAAGRTEHNACLRPQSWGTDRATDERWTSGGRVVDERWTSGGRAVDDWWRSGGRVVDER